MKHKHKHPQTPKDKAKKELGYMREQLKSDGYYDGRFRSKTYETKKEKFLRNRKHRLDKYLETQDI